MIPKSTAGQIPQFMKAVQARDFGDIDKMLSVQDQVPVPRLDTPVEYSNKDMHPLIRYVEKQAQKECMIVKTLAVALAPGDCRVLSGKTRRFQGPPSFPFVPGGDCSGVVVEIPPDETYFQVGDLVTARFTVVPRDALAEYARVSRVCCEKFDRSDMTPEEAAVFASASPATIVSDYIQAGERVLILGANGGIGSHVCQLARVRGASFICGVSNDTGKLLSPPLSCDDAVDYTKEDVFVSPKYLQEPFDTVIDLATGGWPKLVAGNGKTIVKPASLGGRFVTICPDFPTFEAHSFGTILAIFVLKPLWRALTSRLFTRNKLPTFTQANGLPDAREVVTRTLNLAKKGTLKAVLDPKGPFPMTTEGVRKAFRLQESRHAKGKVVVTVSEL